MPRRLIAFAPGWSGLPRHSYNPLIKRFEDTGGFDTVSLSYDMGGLGSISQTANKCAEVLSALVGSHDHVTFIGHSMGGLVGRLIPDTLYDTYISLATPHSGTQAAILGAWWSRSARDMLPSSGLIKSLADKEVKVPAMAISAHLDWLVTDASLKQKGVENLKIPWTDHASVLWSERTFLEIYGWLTYEIFSETGLNNQPGFSANVDL